MANQEHLTILNQGKQVWDKWRKENPKIEPDLSWADLREKVFNEYNFRKVNFDQAHFGKSHCINTDFEEAILKGAYFVNSDLTNAKLVHADLCGSYIRDSFLNGANLVGAKLKYSTLINVELKKADISNCTVYGSSAWDLTLEGLIQNDLVITKAGMPQITVSNLEVAQFIYLLLNRKKLRNVLETITSKAVLILGRFTPERKAVLDSLAEELRKHNLLPIIFDFERCTHLDFTETIKVLAGLSLFVIVDLTKPKATPHELTATVPDYQIPFVPILEEGEDAYSMFSDFKKYDWVLKPIVKYRTKELLLENFRQIILERALDKHKELQRKKSMEFEAMSIEEMIKMKSISV